MRLIGLTGGIGSGKTTVSAELDRRGAVVIDADAITRRLQEPGTAVFDAMVERFGPSIVGPDGTLDRPAVAAIVFNDEAERKALEAIVHPAVAGEIASRMAEVAGTDAVVVHDVPLLAEQVRTLGKARYPYQAVVVVDVDPEVAVARLVEFRGFDEADARARIANQADRSERLALADVVIDNSSDLDALLARVDEVWAWLQALPTPVSTSSEGPSASPRQEPTSAD